MPVNNKIYLENALTLTKSLSMLYINATIESSNEETRAVFYNGLLVNLEMQDDIYQNMKDDGYYNPENIKTSEIKKALKKLTKDESE